MTKVYYCVVGGAVGPNTALREKYIPSHATALPLKIYGLGIGNDFLLLIESACNTLRRRTNSSFSTTCSLPSV